MQFDSFADFLAMGGHAQYVWMAYGTAAIVFVAYAAHLIRARSKIVSELRWQVRAEEEEHVTS